MIRNDWNLMAWFVNHAHWQETRRCDSFIFIKINNTNILRWRTSIYNSFLISCFVRTTVALTIKKYSLLSIVAHALMTLKAPLRKSLKKFGKRSKQRSFHWPPETLANLKWRMHSILLLLTSWPGKMTFVKKLPTSIFIESTHFEDVCTFRCSRRAMPHILRMYFPLLPEGLPSTT